MPGGIKGRDMRDVKTGSASLGRRFAVRRKGCAAAAALALVGLAGCATEPPIAPTPAVAAKAAFTADALVGRWGVGAYHLDKDRPRTEKEARAQCGKPQVVTLGPNGGVMMYQADEKTPQELTVKLSPDGTTYIGPQGPPGIAEDRRVIAYDGTILVSEWVSPEVASRYGTMVMARCKPR
jgi:hypothetical protein